MTTPVVPFTVRAVKDIKDVGALELFPISEWFDPFLPHFMEEALRCGGEVHVAGDESGEVLGVDLFSAVERVASIFTRIAQVAETFSQLHPGLPTYSERRMDPKSEVVELRAADLRGASPSHRMVSRVRLAPPSEQGEVSRLLREVNGQVDEAWFRDLPSTESCFLAEMDGRVVGAACATLVRAHGRVHSLVVRPPYRRLGVGGDLLYARMHWLRSQGAADVLSEIHSDNLASRRVADRLGMTVVGEMYLTPGARSGASPPATARPSQ